MSKALIAIAAALALAPFGSSGSAHAMGATSAPSRYNNATSAANGQQTRYNQANFPITEFSSSSAKTSAPKR